MSERSGLERYPNPEGFPSRAPAPPIPSPVLDDPGELEYHELKLLKDAARSCENVADFVRRGLGATGQPTDAAAEGITGFTSSVELSVLVDSWRSNGKRLADHIDGIAPRLRGTAAAYRGTEERIRARINEIWGIGG
ncbi:hypothetical protein GCM10022254_66720 [Actinomadura meridiana]|uniref:Excreted virulence factor EspC, type VII ESX diderm n=1 Tax=Actinomadura meridiana TaxID=559626 RepID=A0ABP8CLE5_9ACTN